MKVRTGLGASALLLLGGCVQPFDATHVEPVGPTYRPAARGLSSNGASPVEVRTFRGSVSPDTEVAGATCEIASIYYDLTVTTPGVASLPSFATRTPPIRVACTLDGQTVTRDFEPANLTMNEQMTTGGVMGGLLGSIIGAAVTDPATSVFGYQAIRLPFPG